MNFFKFLLVALMTLSGSVLEAMYKCSSKGCTKVYSNVRHLRKHEDNALHCRHCGQSFRAEQQRKLHDHRAMCNGDASKLRSAAPKFAAAAPRVLAKNDEPEYDEGDIAERYPGADPKEVISWLREYDLAEAQRDKARIERAENEFGLPTHAEVMERWRKLEEQRTSAASAASAAASREPSSTHRSNASASAASDLPSRFQALSIASTQAASGGAKASEKSNMDTRN